MSQIAYCQECHAYVQLTRTSECPKGHARSELRDVRAGSLADAPSVATVRTRVAYDPAITEEPNPWVAQIIGKSVVLVPVGLVLAWGLWTGYEQFAGMGMPVWMKLLLSAGSLALTVGGAFLFYRRRT